MQTLNLADGDGSDRHGLICGFVFAAAAPAGRCRWTRPRPGWPGSDDAPAFVRLHFNLADASAERWMRSRLGLAVSARTHPLRLIDRLRQAVKDGGRFGSSMALLNPLLDDQGDVLVRTVREATPQLDAIEDSLQLGRLQRKRADLGKLRRVPGARAGRAVPPAAPAAVVGAA